LGERESADLIRFVVAILHIHNIQWLELKRRHDTEIAIRSISVVFTQEEFEDRKASQPWNLPYAQGC